jgi:hypothetical protein
MEGEREAEEGPSYSDHAWPRLRRGPAHGAVAKSANVALPSLQRPVEGVERVEEALWCCCWKELGHGVTTTVHEREEARGGNGALVLRSGLERARERAGARVRVSGGSVAPLKTSRPDGWGHGRCTAATVRPRGSTELRPVGHDVY